MRVVTSRSPASPPDSPGAPLPRKRKRPPSTAPAGTLTVSVSESARPGTRTVTRFSVPENASSNVTFSVTFMSWPLRGRGWRPAKPLAPAPLKSQFEPNAPSPRRMLSRISAQLPKPPAPAPPKISSTFTEPPAPPSVGESDSRSRCRIGRTACASYRLHKTS